MDNNYISAPSQFEHMEGNSIDFKKTFDLNGTNNDDMLRLYLRKAGLSDEIECLSPEQRRAFIYDIIKSNKMPGYWMPSTMKTTSFSQQPPASRPPPPPPARQDTITAMAELRNEPTTPTLHYATMSTSSSSGSLQSMGKNSPLMPQRFAQPKNVPVSPTTVVKNKNGLKYEISGPINFTHISGDMTRDMTKNAFDLTLTMNDNVLKKYLIERGIKDEELAGMRKQDLIRKIVQSRYTWMPPGHNQIPKNEHQYVGQSNKGETSPPSPATTSYSSSSPPMTPQVSAYQSMEKNEPLSNFALVTSRFADSSQFPSPDSLFSNVTDPYTDVALRPRLPPQTMRPAPPPRKPKNDREYDLVPPPPSFITATPNMTNENEIIPQIPNKNVSKDIDDLYAVPVSKVNRQVKVKKSIAPNNPYLQSFAPAVRTNQETFTETRPPSSIIKSNNFGGVPPPPPPMPSFILSTGTPEPPQINTSNNTATIPQILQTKPNTASSSSPNREESSGDPNEDFLASIRKGVTLKKVEKKGATISGFKPRPVRKLPITEFQKAPSSMVPKKANGAHVPPPPPPMPKPNNGPPNNGAPPPPPPPLKETTLTTAAVSTSNGAPPPPPPPLKETTLTTAAVSAIPNTAYSGDPRDAFLESIRNGVALKKIDKKGATISGIKPRSERKPPVTDFLSELKMGITLKRVKNPNDNIFADGPDESDA